jgi:hypothetical protein
MTINFAHVAIPTLRDVLEGNIIAGTNILAGCLAVTAAAVEADIGNEDVDYVTLDARRDALNAAYAAHKTGNNAGTLEALRRCWSI